ncbi:hypothetical protein MMC08_007164, partial [Hypocenomyce scalaris]|nr:hypothetical protein [Hypocenomyce scalaris]
MVGTRRKRSPGKDDTSKRRKTGEQANRTDTATLKNPMTSTLEQDQSADAARQSPSEDGFDNAIARFMANWEHIAPSKPLAGSISKKSGSLNDSASKSVRFAPTSENPPEDTGNGDQEQVNNQLLWESQTPIMSGANGEDGRPHAELTNTSESSPESASG